MHCSDHFVMWYTKYAFQVQWKHQQWQWSRDRKQWKQPQIKVGMNDHHKRCVVMSFSPLMFARVTPESSRHSYNNSRPSSRTELLLENKKPSYIDNLGIMDDQKRRLSEAGVNRRPSAAHVLTEGQFLFCVRSVSPRNGPQAFNLVYDFPDQSVFLF